MVVPPSGRNSSQILLNPSYSYRSPIRYWARMLGKEPFHTYVSRCAIKKKPFRLSWDLGVGWLSVSGLP